LGTEPVAAARKVAVRSRVLVGAARVEPGLATRGQRTAMGVRMPPSKVLPLEPRRWRLLALEAGAPPLSEVKTTIVLSAWPVASRALRSLPILSSRERVMAAIFLRAAGTEAGTRARVSGVVSMGVWEALKAM
jgi:hypothetical protein